MSTGSFVTTMIATDSGVVCYMKKPDGSIIAEYNTITNDQVKTAQGKHDKDIMQELPSWNRCNNINYTCDVTSNLAAHAWGSKIAIFHLSGGELCYWVHDPFNTKSCTDSDRVKISFKESKTYPPSPDTQLSVTGDSTTGSVVLFYQTTDGNLISVSAHSWTWDHVEKVQKAVRGTGIAAISGWNTHNDPQSYIGVYFQNEKFAIQEAWNTSNWSPRTISTKPKAITSIAASTWFNDQKLRTERIYFQDGDYIINEMCYVSGKALYHDDTIISAFASPFNIFFFRRGTVDNPVLSVWIVSQESRVLVQKTFNTGDGWMGPLYHALPRTFGSD